jgi:hypothetical protein
MLHAYGFIIWPLAAELASWLAMLAIAFIAHQPLQRAAEKRTGQFLRRDRSWAAIIDEDGQIRSRHVFRAAEILVILYHFPVIMVASMVRRDPPMWAWMGVTPLVYGAAWWLLFTRGH